jgi:NAD(P)H dehydrogenase (quinone)
LDTLSLHDALPISLISILQALLIYGMVVAGDPFETGGHYGMAWSGPINEEAMTNARKHGRRIAGLVKKYLS